MCNPGLFPTHRPPQHVCTDHHVQESNHTSAHTQKRGSFVSAAFALLCVSAVNCGSCLATANQSAGRGQPTDAKRQLTAAGKRTSDTPASFD